MKIGDNVKLKYSKKLKNSCLTIFELNKTHVIVKINTPGNSSYTYQKFLLQEICLENENDIINEDFKKGDLVICILNSTNTRKGIIINNYSNYVKVMLEDLKKIRVSKRNILLINKLNTNKSETSAD